MKKEGTGDPRDSNIAFGASVKTRELHFEKVPEPEVRFWGSTRRNSVWESERENLPDEVRENVVYRNAEVGLRIASEVVDNDPKFRNSLEGDRVKVGPERKTEERESEDKEER